MPGPVVKFLADSLDELEDRGASNPAELVMDAFDLAEEMSDIALNRINAIWNAGNVVARRRAWRNDPPFAEYFGIDALTKGQLRRVRRRIRRIEKKLDKVVRIVVHPSSGPKAGACDRANAFQRWGFVKPRKFHLCAGWFFNSNGNVRAVEHRAAIMIHELVHSFGFLDKKGVTGPGEARNLALAKPRRARRNGENYEHFMWSLIEPAHVTA